MHYYSLMKHLSLVTAILLLLCFSSSAQQTPAPDDGAVKDGVYTNTFFGFNFTYPKDWVVHGEATNARIKELGKEKTTKSGALSEESAEVMFKNTYQLLTVFRHPVGTPGIAINPAVLVIAENVAHAPGITSGREYLLNVRQLMVKTGAQPTNHEPVEVSFSGRRFFRDDYRIEANAVRLTQSMFVNVTKGYALAFGFIHEDQKSVDEIARTMDTFKLTAAPAVTSQRP